MLERSNTSATFWSSCCIAWKLSASAANCFACLNPDISAAPSVSGITEAALVSLLAIFSRPLSPVGTQVVSFPAPTTTA